MYYNKAISISIIYCQDFDEPDRPSSCPVQWLIYDTISVDK